MRTTPSVALLALAALPWICGAAYTPVVPPISKPSTIRIGPKREPVVWERGGLLARLEDEESDRQMAVEGGLGENHESEEEVLSSSSPLPRAERHVQGDVACGFGLRQRDNQEKRWRSAAIPKSRLPPRMLRGGLDEDAPSQEGLTEVERLREENDFLRRQLAIVNLGKMGMDDAATEAFGEMEGEVGPRQPVPSEGAIRVLRVAERACQKKGINLVPLKREEISMRMTPLQQQDQEGEAEKKPKWHHASV